jgi:IS30 family transposase
MFGITGCRVEPKRSCLKIKHSGGDRMPSGYNLTERKERQIEEMRDEGLTYSEIASMLGLCRDTIAEVMKRRRRNDKVRDVSSEITV